jgi:glycosyltransferase involved in cell wall biosynthesis
MLSSAVLNFQEGLLEQSMEKSEIIRNYATECDIRSELITQLGETIRELEKQLQSQALQSADEVCDLQKQLVNLNLTLLEAKRSCDSMSRRLSWRVTRPLREILDAGVRRLQKVKHHPKAPGIDPDAASSATDPQMTGLVDLIRASALFDAKTYDGAADALAQGLDPALHYILMGEKQGLKPSSAFDPIYYGERYPDVAAWGGNRLGHYLEAGQFEGRRALPVACSLTLSVAGIKPERPTILLLIHEASRTGAPIIGWNIVHRLRGRLNVVVILMREGSLEKAFGEVAQAVVGPVGNDIFEPVEASGLARRLIETYRPLYAIANSAETRSFVPGLIKQAIPVVALVHEFSSRLPPGSLQALYENATEIVFPADIVRSASEIDYPFLSRRQTHILPQGPSEVPRSHGVTDDLRRAEEDKVISSRLRPEGAEGDIVVIGIGYVEWRKGIDLFIAAATAVLACQTEPPVRFVWVGDGYQSPAAMEVSSYLSEQIARSGLGDRFNLVAGVDNVECIYKKADILFLSSRLDPLPNVSIDAALHGIPIVCFAGASGIAEILASSDVTRELVVPHLDVAAAVTLLCSLAADRNKIQRFGDAVRAMARTRFDMGAYVAKVDALGRRARQGIDQ